MHSEVCGIKKILARVCIVSETIKRCLQIEGYGFIHTDAQFGFTQKS